jgi:hypothetical protein
MLLSPLRSKSPASPHTTAEEEDNYSPTCLAGTPSSENFRRYKAICSDHEAKATGHAFTREPLDGQKRRFIDARYAGGARAFLLMCATRDDWSEPPSEKSGASESRGNGDGTDEFLVDENEEDFFDATAADAGSSDESAVTGAKVTATDHKLHIYVIWLADSFIYSHLYKSFCAQKSILHGSSEKITKHVWLNHFPGASHDVHKASLGKELNRLRSMLKEAWPSAGAMDFYPQSFLLPTDEAAAASFLETNTAIFDNGLVPKASSLRTLIVKPSKGSQGKGIHLIQHPRAVRDFAKVATSEMKVIASDEDFFVCQEYLSRPVILGGLKVTRAI